MWFDRFIRNILKIARFILTKFIVFIIIICEFLIAFIILFYSKFISIFKIFKLELNYNYFFIFVKLFCLSILLKSGFSLTSDYLGFPFEYKLIVSENKNGFDFPSISVCTENNILFDKRKIIEHFGLHIEWNEFDYKLSEEFWRAIDKCNQTIQNYINTTFGGL